MFMFLRWLASFFDMRVNSVVVVRATRAGCALLALVIALNFALTGCSPREATLTRHEFAHLAMGVRINAVVYASDLRTARDSVAAAFAEISHLDELLSDYRPESQLSLVSSRAAGVPTPIDDSFAEALRDAISIADRTDGAFDPTVGPLVGLWRSARKEHRLPQPDALAAALAAVGWRDIDLAYDAGHATLSLRRPGMKIDPGGFAKGFAAQRALRILHQRGIDHAMIAIAGDIACAEPPPGQQGWRVAVSHGGASPDRVLTLLLRNRAVSTSGDTEQFVEIEGTRYSHIVDPRTGLGLTNRAAATVVAPDATTSDALATALCVAGIDRFEAIMARFPACEARLEEAGHDAAHEPAADPGRQQGRDPGTAPTSASRVVETPGFAALAVHENSPVGAASHE